MAGSIINDNGSSSITITNLIDQLQSVRRGMDETSLTNYSTQALPAISAGSVCEIAGSIYRFSTEEPISTAGIISTTNFTYFVELVPSSSECTAQFSSVIPAWREDYNGFYLSTASNHRVIAEMEKQGASTLYYYKNEFKYLDRERNKKLFIYSAPMSTILGVVYADHYLTNFASTTYNRIKSITGFIYGGAATLYEWNDVNPGMTLMIQLASTKINFVSNSTGRSFQMTCFANIVYV